MTLILLGAVAMANCAILLFFIRFWRTTRDKFFLIFGTAFLVDAVERVLVGIIPHSDEQDPLFYLIRLFAFAIILYAVIYKNRMMRQKK